MSELMTDNSITNQLVDQCILFLLHLFNVVLAIQAAKHEGCSGDMPPTNMSLIPDIIPLQMTFPTQNPSCL